MDTSAQTRWLKVGVAIGAIAFAGRHAASAQQQTFAPLTPPEIEAQLNAPGAHDSLRPELPIGIDRDAVVIPADNPMTPAKVELGKQLYFDSRLSRDNTVSCATCHHPTKGWTDQLPVSTGINGQQGGRSAPTIMNRILSSTQFWDGRAASLEAQAVGPIENPIEMGFTHDEVVARTNSIGGYRVQFERIFGGPATIDAIGKAIATFERTVITGGAPNDYWEALEYDYGWEPETDDDPEDAATRAELLAAYAANSMSESALRGREIYHGKARCSACHIGTNFADEQYHNIGVGMDAEHPDVGRKKISGSEKDMGAFKTPTLRNIVDSAPYMHDGSEATLEDVVVFYNKGGVQNPWLSGNITPLNLTPIEQADLVNFLREGLTGTVTVVEEPHLPE